MSRHSKPLRAKGAVAGAVALCCASAAQAQRTSDNAVTAAQDAFGVSVGTERIGIYSPMEVRGFSPQAAGNVRLEGIYVDLPGNVNNSLSEGNTIRVGLSALSYPFPAPTGIVDYRLRSGSGGPSISPAVQIGSFGAGSIEVEGFLPLAGDALTLSGAFALRRSSENSGGVNRIFNFGLVPRWKPSDHVQITPFWGYSRNREDVQPAIFVSGSYLPPLPRQEDYRQPWALGDRINENVGLLSRISLGGRLTLQTGVVRSRQVNLESYSDFYRNTTRDGVADHVVSASPPTRRASTSGEARLTWRKVAGEFIHTAHLTGRGRQATNRYGGASSVALGKAVVGVRAPLPRPNFVFVRQSEDDVRQLTVGIGYEGVWTRRGQLSVGLQRSTYEKTVQAPGAAATSVKSQPWLYNVAGAVNVSSRLALYGAYTRGMEENGTAPDAAANRGEPLPSAITSQREMGFRYAVRPGFNVVGALFKLKKPYFNLDSRNVFTELGALSTRGAELSVAGALRPRLSIVAGAVLMDPRVSGEAVAMGRVGERPVAQTRQLVRANLDYRLPFLSGVSVDAAVVHSGPVTASVRPDAATGKQFEVSGATTFDFGARYRFKIAEAPAVIRLQVLNLTNVRAWEATSSGALRLEGPRRVQVQLSADF